MAPTMEAVKKALPINWALIGNPVNWVVILLMLAIAGVAIAYIIPFNPDTIDGE